MIRAFWLRVTLTFCLCGVPAVAQLDQQSLVEIKAVQAEALTRPSSYELLQTLSDKIGPRLTGTPSEARAREWAVREMHRIGLSKVHVEPWQLKRGWRRGYARAEIVAPFHLGLTVASYGWSGSTPENDIEGDVVLVDSGALDQVARQRHAEWSGKILLLLPSNAGHFDVLQSLSHLPDFVSAARAAHVVAVIASDMRPGILMAHTGPVSFSGGWTDLPVVDMASEPKTRLRTQRRPPAT